MLGPWLASVCFEVPTSWMVIDTLPLAWALRSKGLLPGAPGSTLRDLAGLLGIDCCPAYHG